MFFDLEPLNSHLRQLAYELKSNFTGGSIIMLSQDNQFEINLYPPALVCGARPMLQIPARFEIKTTATSYPNFMVRKNDLIDWISEHILLKHDFQTKDEAFDSSYYISVDDPGWGTRYFAQSIARSSISNITTGGLHRVYCVNQELKGDKFIKTFEELPSSNEIAGIIDKLNLLISIQ